MGYLDSMGWSGCPDPGIWYPIRLYVGDKISCANNGTLILYSLFFLYGIN